MRAVAAALLLPARMHSNSLAPLSLRLAVLAPCLILGALVGPLSPRPALANPVPIVGGEASPAGAWPDVVGVIGTNGRCTGTLIASDVVLTAGHCEDVDPQYVVIGAIDLAPGMPGVRIPVKSIRAYPAWWNTYDVAAIVLAAPALAAPRPIATACVANKALASGAPLTVVGFGLATPDGSDANTRLRQARMAVVDPFCTSAPGCNDDARPNGEIAAGGRGIDSCFGDSGGPAYLDTPAGPAVTGVVSRSLDVVGPACSAGGIYVRADKVVSWIESVTQREIARIDCSRPSDEPASAAPAETEVTDGGCSSSGAGTGGMVLFALCAALRVRRKRQ